MLILPPMASFFYKRVVPAPKRAAVQRMRSMAKTFHDFMQGRTTKSGHFAEFDIKFTDKTTETIEVPAEKLLMLATAIQTASTVAPADRRNLESKESLVIPC
jgi:hypothetical protein